MDLDVSTFNRNFKKYCYKTLFKTTKILIPCQLFLIYYSAFMYLKLITKTKKIVSDSYFTIKKKKKNKSPESKRIPKSIRFRSRTSPSKIHSVNSRFRHAKRLKSHARGGDKKSKPKTVLMNLHKFGRERERVRRMGGASCD